MGEQLSLDVGPSVQCTARGDGMVADSIKVRESGVAVCVKCNSATWYDTRKNANPVHACCGGEIYIGRRA